MHTMSPTDLSILLAEPSDVQRKIIVKHLKDEEVQHITEAGSLADAQAAIAEHTPDLVISALHFADGTGLDLLTQLKKNPATADIGFMLVSSETSKAQLEQFKQSGVIAILPKPFSRLHLGKALNAAMDLLQPSELQLSLYDITDVRVLLVDDSKLARNHIRKVLSNLGINQITEAVDGQEAIQTLNNQLFDLVVTDYNMPEVNGQELTEFIRNSSSLSHIPVLMVTSEANESHLSNIAQSGVNALCDKPFEPETVRALLFKLLEEDHV